MRLKNVPGCRERIADSEYVIPEEELVQTAGKWNERFEKPAPIRIEIGMGKGRFLHELALLNPDINLLVLLVFLIVVSFYKNNV